MGEEMGDGAEKEACKNSLNEAPEGVGDPTAASDGAEDLYANPPVCGKEAKDIPVEEDELGQQQEQLDQPNPAVRNDVVMDNTNINPFENPPQVEGSASDSEPSFMSDYNRPASARATDILISVSVSTDMTKRMILDYANLAMEDLVSLSKKEFNPFDIRPSDHRMRTASVDNRRFSGSENLHLEASRETAYVGMHRQSIVEMLMDSNRWAAKFSDLVSRAITIAIIHPGTPRSYEGSLKVMTAEFHIPTPLVPARESYFARYCKKLSDDTWGVVDISLESMFPYPASTKYRRRPSGCLIQELANGCSKVTWVELVEVDNSLVPRIFHAAVCSGFAFGAQRWVVAIAREYDLLQARMNRTPCYGLLTITPEGRRSLLKLVERMMRGFFRDVSASSRNVWMPLPLHGDGNIKFMVKDARHNSGLPGGRTIVLSTSMEIPVPPRQVFDFLSDVRSRSKWDFLSQNHAIREFSNMVIGANPESCVSILEIKNNSEDSTDTPMFYLQKSYTDSTFSYVVYAPIDAPAISMILSGGDSDSVVFLTSGFNIFPNQPILPGEESTGSLLTVMFHILDAVPREDHYRLSLKSLKAANDLVSGTIKLIKDHVAPGHQPDRGRQGNPGSSEERRNKGK